MRTFTIVFSVIVAAALIYTAEAHGQESVVISEIAWMGSNNGGKPGADAADEWIEIYNASSEAVDLTGWILESTDGTPSIDVAAKVTGSAIIPAGGFFLFERTDDNSVPAIPADVIYTGALSNSGEILVLKDTNGNTVEQIDASGGWPAGDNTTKKTMQRTDSGWVTAEPTPRTTNKSTPLPPPEPGLPSESAPQSGPPLAEEPEPAPVPPPENLPLSDPAPPSPLPPPQATTSQVTNPPPAPPPPPQSLAAVSVPSAGQQKESSSKKPQEPLAAVSSPVKEDSNGNSGIFWVIIVVLLALNAGLLYVIRAQKKELNNRDVSLE